MKRLLSLSIAVFIFGAVEAQQTRPALVVGIVVDQMRQDYIYRYWDTYGDRGFKRLVGEGFMARNMHYNYVPTSTGPGHASVYTGSTPSYHGIIGNSWYDKASGQNVNCVGDESVSTVGADNSRGHASPHRLVASTITDELKLASQGRSKVISVSIKDRGSILPAGHMADGAYWFDAATGNFVSSSFYVNELPKWVEGFNKKNYVEKYIKGKWDLLLPKNKYTASGPDASPYEGVLRGKDSPTFPYDLREIAKEYDSYDWLNVTPYGNQLVADMAIAALRGEDLGRRGETDFLAISFSSPDYAGHTFGPNAVELQDMYLRLDIQIGELLDQLDEYVGDGNYTLFLTADHGVVDVGKRLQDLGMPSLFESRGFSQELNRYLGDELGRNDDFILATSNGQIFFDHSRLKGTELSKAEELAVRFLMEQDGIFEAYTSDQLRSSSYSDGGIKGFLVRSFNQDRGGDVSYITYPPYVYSNTAQTGTGHGSPFTYDTNVPLLMYGTGVKPGDSAKKYAITDIAPTLAVMLGIRFPNMATGEPIVEVMQK